MTRGLRVYLSLIAILAAVTVEEMLQFLPHPVAHAAGFAVMFTTFGLIFEVNRPWYVVAPVVFLVMLLPTWVAVVLLVAMTGWVMRTAYRGRTP